jgi:release factor glutamine methyltransferase
VITLHQALAQTTVALEGAGVASPQSEARTLASFALQCPPTRLALVSQVSPAQEAGLRQVVAERVAGKPLQYITGQAFFRTTSVQVGPGVFIPRPETELLAGWAIDQVRARGPVSVVELCAGSGAISLAIAEEAPGAAQWAVEIDDQAWEYLRRNLADTTVVPVLGDMAQALPELDGQVAVVVANPPYIPQSWRDQLWPTLGHEPDRALYQPGDGLGALTTVVTVAARLLQPGGVVGCEHGDGQAPAVIERFARTGFVEVVGHQDLTGRPRFVTAVKPGMQ